MRQNILSLLIRAVMLAVFAVLLVGQASAHPGHRDGIQTTSSRNATDSRQGFVSERAQVHAAPGCPGHGGGECCCDEAFAHLPPQPQSHLIAPPALSLPAATVARDAGVRAWREPSSPGTSVVVDSRGPRGPPSA